jgi:PAS domain S-box-containing protein
MELSIYDQAFARYLNTINFPKTPLASWDIYSNYFTDLKKSISDTVLLRNFEIKNKWQCDWNMQQELQDQTVIVLTDVNLKIVFASKNMVAMNGYLPSEVIGQHPKMFQGEATDNKVSKIIGEAVKNQLPFQEVVVNYCKDGSLYKCEIKGYPIFDTSGKLRNFIAFEKMVA